MERDVLTDRLKGYACFLVLFGHVILGIRNAGIYIPQFFYGTEKFIWSFHVSLFLFLSGAVYEMTGEWKSKGTKAEFIKYKLINLGIPYAVFSSVYILINSFVGGANTQSSVRDILEIWKYPVAQYWFLYALFFLFCIWTLMSGAMKNPHITAAIAAAGYLAPIFGASFGCFDVVVYSALAFGVGTCMKISAVEGRGTVVKICIICAHLISAAVLIKCGIIGYPAAKELIMLLGICASISFVSLIQKFSIAAMFLDFMSKYSFQIYLLHTIFTAGIRIALMRADITQWYIHIICGCIFGIIFSVAAAEAARRSVILDIFFFPSGTWKRIRQREAKSSEL